MFDSTQLICNLENLIKIYIDDIDVKINLIEYNGNGDIMISCIYFSYLVNKKMYVTNIVSDHIIKNMNNIIFDIIDILLNDIDREIIKIKKHGIIPIKELPYSYLKKNKQNKVNL